MVFIANPNNPTGTLLEKSSLSDFCERASERTIIFCDEAYYDYIEDAEYPSMDYLVREGKNVIVSRTFSKVYGMAGLRIGYLVLKDLYPETYKNITMVFNDVDIMPFTAEFLDYKTIFKLVGKIY